jgi:hypothetical protein
VGIKLNLSFPRPANPLCKTKPQRTCLAANRILNSIASLRGLLLVTAQAECRLAAFKQAWLLVCGLAFADRTLLLGLLLARAESHHVALAAATPVVSTGGGLWLVVVTGSVDVLCEARVVWVVVGDDVALAWL